MSFKRDPSRLTGREGKERATAALRLGPGGVRTNPHDPSPLLPPRENTARDQTRRQTEERLQRSRFRRGLKMERKCFASHCVFTGNNKAKKDKI